MNRPALPRAEFAATKKTLHMVSQMLGRSGVQLDAKHLNAGFWPGDDDSPEAIFYGYLVPRPPNCETAPIEPRHANWVEAMNEWLLPYEAVRASEDPHTTLLDFLHSLYGVAVEQGGWDKGVLDYVRPTPPARD